MLAPAQPQPLYKFGNGALEDQPWMYQNIWALEHLASTDRLIIAPRIDYICLIESLLDVMPEPIWLLYVLVVPRGEGEAGRYQSAEPQSREHVRRFLSEFRAFLENDGRQNLWLLS